jgi:hypothetical protein
MILCAFLLSAKILFRDSDPFLVLFPWYTSFRIKEQEESIMRTREPIYLSDYLSVPTPKRASSRQAYFRKVRNRQFLWLLLPYLVQGMLFLAAAGMTMVGVMVLLCGLGG